MKRPRTVSSNQCETIREDVARQVDEQAGSLSARRRRQLHRGATRFHRDVCNDPRPFHRVLVAALTVRELEPDVASGAMQRLMEALKTEHERAWRHARAPGRGTSEVRDRELDADFGNRTEVQRGRMRAATRARAASQPAVPAHDGRLARGPVRGADVFPGDAGRAHAAYGVEDRLVKHTLQREETAQVLRVLVPESRRGAAQDPLEEGHVVERVNRAAGPAGQRRFHGKSSLPCLRYLWWAEFQKRGAIHYHLVLVDPPFGLEREARAWFDAHWTDAQGRPLAGIQTWCEWKSAAWFKGHAADYVLKDVGKGVRKGYEQVYDGMPKGWRTFRSHQLVWPAKIHALHETKAHAACLRDHVHTRRGCFDSLWLYRVDIHVPARGGCHLPLARAKPKHRVGTTSPPVSGSQVVQRCYAGPCITDQGRATPGVGLRSGPPLRRSAGFASLTRL